MREQPLEKIDWTNVESSNVKCLFFDEKTQTICVTFHNGGIYTYIGASMEIYMSLIHAPSVGKYLNNVIKSFPYTRWEDEKQLLAHLNH
jgi:hypothetical protein